jgi:hypothetical protein
MLGNCESMVRVLLHGWFHEDNWKHRTLLSYILIVHAAVAERRLERRVGPMRSSSQNLETIDPDLYPHPPLSDPPETALYLAAFPIP